MVVGIGQHTGNRPKGTVGGAGDATAMADVLRLAGFNDVRVLVDGQATGAAIRAGIDWLKERSSAGSFTVFHYSGHVYQRTGDLDRDGEALDEFLVPYDSRSIISDRELVNRLDGVKGWLWTNISGCEAAGFDDSRILSSGGRRLFTGSSLEHQKSYERPDWRMSVYTGLSANEAALRRKGDANGDGHVSIHEMFRYAETHAPGMTAKQKKGVQNPYLAGGDGTEWFLKAPPPPPPPPSSGGSGGSGGSPPPQKICLAPGLCL